MAQAIQPIEQSPNEIARAAHVRAVEEIQYEIAKCEKVLAKFAEVGAESGYAYAMRWHGQPVMKAEKVVVELKDLMHFIERTVEAAGANVDYLHVCTAVAAGIATDMARTVDRLVGDTSWGGDGPWTGGSTCAISNLIAVEDCNAMRVVLGVQRSMLRILKSTIANVEG